MNFFQKLFRGTDETKSETKEQNEAKDFEVLKYDGVRALKTGQYDYAERCFKHALDLKDDLEIHDHLSVCHLSSGEFGDAYEELRLLADAQPDNVQILIRMANVAFMMEDYNIMASNCEKALLIDKDNAEVNYLYAQASKGQGDDVNTVALSTKAIALDKRFGDAYLLRGETLLRMEKPDEADEDALWLLQHTDNQEEVLLLKARIEQARNNKAVALEYYHKALESNPFSETAYKERAELYAELGEDDKAAADNEKAEALRRRNEGEANELGENKD